LSANSAFLEEPTNDGDVFKKQRQKNRPNRDRPHYLPSKNGTGFAKMRLTQSLFFFFLYALCCSKSKAFLRNIKDTGAVEKGMTAKSGYRQSQNTLCLSLFFAEYMLF